MDSTCQPNDLTHSGLIERGGGPAFVGRAIEVDPNTTKAWKRLNSIPAAYWSAIAEAGIATLDELAEAAANRRQERAA